MVVKTKKKKADKEKRFNLLAANRRSKYCMGPIVADEGMILVASDLVSVEPNIMLNLSDDDTLRAVLYEMKGKRPVWTDKGVLLTDSLYITTMSSGPLLGPVLREQGDAWLDLYADDSDAGKDKLGNTYRVSKSTVLGALYGMQHNRLSKEYADMGITLPPAECRKILNGFWESVPKLKEVRDIFIYEFKQAYKKKMPYVTPFGFILPTEKCNDALNYVVQSSVSAWIRTLNKKVFSVDYAHLVATIHDELIVQVEAARADEYREHLLRCVDETNEFFQLQYPLQIGWKVADNFYGFKG